MASTDARPVPQKNVAYRVTFPIFDADGDLVTGATGLDSEVSKDGGTFADCTNEATEIATNSGMYYLDLTSTEMNADTVAIIVKTSSSGAKTTPIVIYPEEAGDVRVNVTQVNGTTQTAGDLAALINTVDDFLDTEIAAIKAKTDNLPSDPADASDIASSFTTVNTKLDTIDDFLDTEIAAIKAKTDNLPSDPADASDIASSFSTVNTKLDTIDDFLDTEIAAIKTKTDNLPSDPADASDIASSFSTVNTKLDTIDDFLDTEVAAIKAKTDNLPSDPADASDVASSFSTVNSTLSTIAGYIDTEVSAIKAKTDNLPASPASTSDVLAQVNAALDAASTELTAIPTTTGSLRHLIQFLHAYFRNKKTQTSSTETLYKEDASTALGTATLSDNGTTASKGEMN
jgi:hypothetical protein